MKESSHLELDSAAWRASRATSLSSSVRRSCEMLPGVNIELRAIPSIAAPTSVVIARRFAIPAPVRSGSRMLIFSIEQRTHISE